LKSRPIILKLGGSAITRKEKALTPRIGVIKRLAKEIARAEVAALIVLHGGGSFGHPVAEKYRLTNGLDDPSQLIGFVETHEAMVSLNRLVVNALIENGVPALGMPPSSFMLMKQGKIQILGMKTLKEAISKGLVPVLYGDVAFDLEKGFNILSGDKIASFLATKLDARRIVMAVDVDGVFTDDPKIEPAAELIRKLKLSDLERLQVKITRSSGSDVTGGMFGKISELADPVERGIEALIVNALKPGNIYKALRGGEVIGTKVTNK
jgi:isopentenyl phosphate kinase